MGELTKTSGMGKQSPGPIYQYNEDIKYKQVSLPPYSVATWMVIWQLGERT
jgi:hypothetical protein